MRTTIPANPDTFLRITSTRRLFGRRYYRLAVVAGPHTGRRFWVRSGTRHQMNQTVVRRLGAGIEWRWA